MTATDSQLLPQLPGPPAHLGRTAARGMLWMFGQTIGVKLVSMVANIVLARIIAKDDFGRVGLAYNVVSIAGFVQFIGIQDVLVQRQAHFRRWANPAFWLTLTVGLIGSAMIAITAPIAARWYHDSRLTAMILLLALASPFQTTIVVPQASLSANLRFRASALIGGMAAFIGMYSIFSVLLASMGAGAYSILVPAPVLAIMQSIVMWSIARPPIRRNPQFRRWKHLLGDTGYNWGVSICLIIITNVDYTILGRLFSKATVGIYFNSLNFSTQLLRLLSTNLMSVLLPSLSRLQHDRTRQVNAFVQAARVLTAVGIPACLLQAAAAGPAVRIFYPTWHGMIPVVRVLSIGMAFYFVCHPATSMLKAQGRFRSVFMLYLVHALTMCAAVMWCAWIADDSTAAVRISTGVAICLGGFGPAYMLLAIAHHAKPWLTVLRVFAGPTIASVITIGVALAINARIAAGPHHDWISLAVMIAMMLTIYPAFLSLIDREAWIITITRLRAVIARTSEGGVTPPIAPTDP
jgi:O-antigen/teichoic acid export membrane protein